MYFNSIYAGKHSNIYTYAHTYTSTLGLKEESDLLGVAGTTSMERRAAKLGGRLLFAYMLCVYVSFR